MILARSNDFDRMRIGQTLEHDLETAGNHPAAPFLIRIAMDAIKALHSCQWKLESRNVLHSPEPWLQPKSL
jgi:hypothetical protein